MYRACFLSAFSIKPLRHCAILAVHSFISQIYPLFLIIDLFQAVEREEELTDFVSTAKGVLQSLVEKHFPAPDREKINRILGISKPKSILDELGISLKKNGASAEASTSNSNSNLEVNGGKRKRKATESMKKKAR
jgi:hypothetical protein